VDRLQLCQEDRRSCLQLLSNIQSYQRFAAPGDALISQQVGGLALSAQQSINATQDCEERVLAIAGSLSELFDSSSRNGHVLLDRLNTADDTLHALGSFGMFLEADMEEVARKRRREGCGSWQRGAKWGSWDTVATDEIVLQRTQDPNLVRSLRNPRQELGVRLAGSSIDAAVIEASADLNPPEQQHAQLLHGGPDGEYHKCDLTGKWVPIGYAATVAERDCGERGATAGFFVSY